MRQNINFGKLLHGGDYNPEQWLEYPEILEQDLAYFKKAKLTLPTAKAGGFLFLPPLHWQIPYGTAMSYTVSTGYIYTVPACPAVQFSYLYADCSCSPFFKILMPAFVSRS